SLTRSRIHLHLASTSNRPLSPTLPPTASRLPPAYREEGVRFASLEIPGRMNSALKILTGGQTGADRAALDAAMDAGIECGGWCPANREAEDGIIPDSYPVAPLPNAGYDQRTTQNVIDSDGTVVFASPPARGGSKFTLDECRRLGKPVFGV